MPGTRRTFLIGLGRFAVGAAALSIRKPPVLYSFPSEIRVATWQEQLALAALSADPATWYSIQWRPFLLIQSNHSGNSLLNEIG